jgi:1,4-dihydroxy-2-naphthoyl-CoA hydrolase
MIEPHWSVEELQAAPAGFVHRRIARFQDIDAAGIVYFPTILSYFHDAYADLLTAGGCSIADALKTHAWAAPIREVQARFLKPIRFGDALEVCIVGAAHQGSDLAVGYRVQTEGNATATAVGMTTHVFVDAGTFKRMEMPDAVKACFKPFQPA